MPAVKFWLVFIGAVGFTLFSLFSAYKNFIRARLIEDMPTSQVRSASQGYVELVGSATSQGNELCAPLTGQPCLWWRYTIEHHQKSGKSSSWRTIDKGTSSTPFFMSDSSGICRIEPKGAEISCLHKKVWRGSSRVPATANIEFTPGIFDKLNSSMGLGRYRYTEYLIKDGDPLYLLGHFVSDATGKRVLTVDQVAGQIIRRWKKSFDALLVKFDRDGNGVLDEKEWDIVRKAARQVARKKQLETSREEIEHTLQKPDSGNLPYLIGSHGQEVLSRRYRWWAAGCALGFLALGAASTWLLGSRFIS